MNEKSPGNHPQKHTPARKEQPADRDQLSRRARLDRATLAVVLERRRLVSPPARSPRTLARPRPLRADPLRREREAVCSPHRVSVTVFASELDLAAISGFERQLESASLEHPQQITLDMHRVEFMDCSGLGAIERGRARLGERGIRLTVRSLRPQPLWLIGFAGLDVAVEL